MLEAPDIPAATRAVAARTLAEMEGLIGRHAAPPERHMGDVALLSREELVRELDQLRARDRGAGAAGLPSGPS